MGHPRATALAIRAPLVWPAAVAALAAAAAIWPRAAALSGLALLGAIVWHHPRAAQHAISFAALAVRPSLDQFSERQLGLGPFALQPAAIFGGLVLVAGVVLALRRSRDGLRLWPDRGLLWTHGWLAAAYGIMTIAGVWWYGSQGAGQAVREVLRVASIVAAFLVMYWWLDEDPRAVQRAWLYLGLGAVLPILVALEQFVTGTGFIEPDGTVRLQGTFSHPNSFGQYLIPFVCALVVGSGRRVTRMSLAVALSVVVALTYSRTAILALAAALAIALVLETRLEAGRATRLIAVVMVVGGAIWLLAGELITRRFTGIAFDSASIQDALAGQSENSFQWRVINWSGLILLGLNHPWMGHGAGMTTVLNPIVNEDTGVPFNAHDDYVRFFFEGGVTALVCYLVFQALLIAWLVRRSRVVAGPQRSAAIALGGALCGMTFLTAGTTELSLHTANQYVLYGVLAIAACERRPSAASG
jgi:O-antigen ligase